MTPGAPTTGTPVGRRFKETDDVAIPHEQVLKALATVTLPASGASLPASGRLSEVVIDDAGRVMFSIAIDPTEAPAMEPVRQAAEAAVKALPGVEGVFASLTADRPAQAGAASAPQEPPGRPRHAATSKAQLIPGVKHVIAVASGKGGVGKSTTACNLALGLKLEGLTVGLLDADIYGPSMPKLFGIHGKPRVLSGRILEPMDGYGIRVMSIGFLVDEEAAMIWRGPMVMSAITQMLRDVAWGTLDVLVVDMPPGTGDAQLTLAQNVPLKGAIIISTPQDLSLIDARRGLAMFRKVNVPVLGIVENMSYFQCPQCGTRSDIFGHGGARLEAERLGVPFLGEIPLHMSIRATSDSGTPVVDSEPDGPHAAIYRAIGSKVREQLQGAIAAA
jgi:ATP-binding protein involved in chromosome partitioning